MPQGGFNSYGNTLGRNQRIGSGPTVPVPDLNQPPVNPQPTRDPRGYGSKLGYQPPIQTPAVQTPAVPKPPIQSIKPTVQSIKPTVQAPVVQTPATNPVVQNPVIQTPVQQTVPPANTVNVSKGPNLNPNAPPDPTKMTALGQQARDTIQRNLSNPGAPLTAIGGRVQQDITENLNNPQKNQTQFGDIANQNLLKEAQSGQLYGMGNLAASTERANALNTSRTQNQTQESLASRGILPGTAGYARALSLANAGSQSSNLDRTQALNAAQVAASKDINARLGAAEATGYNKYRTALGDASGLETNAQNAQQTALGQATAADQTSYNRGQTAYTQGEAGRLENKTSQTSLINSVTDPRTKALLQGVQNAGGNVQEAYNQVYGIKGQGGGAIGGDNAGTIGEGFRSSTPSQVEVKGLTDEFKSYNPKTPGETDEAYNARIQGMVNKTGNQIITQKYAPLDTGTKDAEAKVVQEKLNTATAGQPLSASEFEIGRKSGAIKQFTTTNIPSDAASVNKFLLDNPSGIISLGGVQYKLNSGASPRTGRSKYTNSPRHKDVATVTDANNNQKYVWDGKIQDKPPGSVGDVQITPWGW